MLMKIIRKGNNTRFLHNSLLFSVYSVCTLMTLIQLTFIPNHRSFRVSIQYSVIHSDVFACLMKWWDDILCMYIILTLLSFSLSTFACFYGKWKIIMYFWWWWWELCKSSVCHLPCLIYLTWMFDNFKV